MSRSLSGWRASPRVAVLMAAFEGERWLHAQVSSILGQVGVSVEIFVSLDPSRDRSREVLERMVKDFENIRLLDELPSSGSACQNFLRLIRDVQTTDFDFVAFADQDDIWDCDKLSGAIEEMETKGTDGFSSSVLAFWSDGRSKLVSKAGRMHAFNHLFESPGPGCTFVIRPAAIAELRRSLQVDWATFGGVWFHDWLVYAWVRGSGGTWTISRQCRMFYRQHDGNVFGARASFGDGWARFRTLIDGSYFQQVALIDSLVSHEASFFCQLLQRGTLVSRLRLIPALLLVRRRWMDRIAIVVGVLVGKLR